MKNKLKATVKLFKWQRKKVVNEVINETPSEEKEPIPRLVKDLLKVRAVKKDDEDVFIICMGDMMVDEQPYLNYEDAQKQIEAIVTGKQIGRAHV